MACIYGMLCVDKRIYAARHGSAELCGAGRLHRAAVQGYVGRGRQWRERNL